MKFVTKHNVYYTNNETIILISKNAFLWNNGYISLYSINFFKQLRKSITNSDIYLWRVHIIILGTQQN